MHESTMQYMSKNEICAKTVRVQNENGDAQMVELYVRKDGLVCLDIDRDRNDMEIMLVCDRESMKFVLKAMLDFFLEDTE